MRNWHRYDSWIRSIWGKFGVFPLRTLRLQSLRKLFVKFFTTSQFTTVANLIRDTYSINLENIYNRFFVSFKPELRILFTLKECDYSCNTYGNVSVSSILVQVSLYTVNPRYTLRAQIKHFGSTYEKKLLPKCSQCALLPKQNTFMGAMCSHTGSF